MHNIDTILQYFATNDIHIDPSSIRHTDRDSQFSVEGPRNSIVIYSVWGNGIVDAWFGKSDSDSGGLKLQGSANNLSSIIKLHKRFMQSGRRKILRNYKRGR